MEPGETQLEHELGPEGLTPTQERLCESLFTIGAVRFGEFRIKAHETNPDLPLSAIYINLRDLQRYPEAKRAAVAAYVELMQTLEFDVIVGIPEAAVPIASSVCDVLNKGQITPRAAKSHGIPTRADGYSPLDRGLTAVVLDDLITTSKSKEETIKLLLDLDINVEDVVVLIDREQGGAENLATAGYRLHSALTLDQMLDYYRRQQLISEEEYERVKNRLDEMNLYLSRRRS